LTPHRGKSVGSEVPWLPALVACAVSLAAIGHALISPPVARGQPGPHPSRPIELLVKTPRASRQVPGLSVARSSDELAAIWTDLNRGDPIPEIDFRKQMVIAYFMGGLPMAGFTVEIRGVGVRAGQLVCDVVEIEHCGGIAVPVSPAVGIVTRSWPRDVVAEVRQEVRGCREPAE
jgi:hypothetical protein